MAQPVAAPQCAVALFALKDAPALIEHLLPVQKLSAEVVQGTDGRHTARP